MNHLFRIALAHCLFVPSLAVAQPNFLFYEPMTPSRSAQVIVHRGLANAAPENSARAIEMCIEDFCEWVAIDVRLTKDGQHVIVRNETVDATTDGTGRVSDLTVDELKKLDAGAWFAPRFEGTRILTLREALSVAKGKINLLLDCRHVDPKSLVDDIVAAGMESQAVVLGDASVLARVKALSKGAVAIIAPYHGKLDFDAFVKDVSPAAVEMDAADANAELCQKFHRVGIKVEVRVRSSNQDSSDVAMRAINAGVDWLKTSDPTEPLFMIARRKIDSFPVKIACHRGASRYAPENSLPAIRLAAAMGVDFAEIDIRTTQDERTVLMHDGSVNRTTDGMGPVRNLNYAEATALSAGKWFGKPFQKELVPSFDVGLAEYGTKMGAYLDAKDVAPEVLITMIKKYGLAERHVVYQSSDYCNKLRKLDPTVRTMPPLKRVEDIEAVATSKPYAVDAAWSILSEEMIAKCHHHGIKVFSDALGRNENVEQYQKAIHWGIDCIQTDHPLRVLRAIEIVSAERSRR